VRQAWRLLLGLLLAARAGAEAEAGFVESFAGDASGYAIERGAESLPVAVLAPLRSGDRVRITRADGAITLRLGHGEAVAIDARGDPYLVPAPTEASVIANLAEWAQGWVTGSEEQARSVGLMTRSAAALDLPALPRDATPRLVAREAPLHLHWVGAAAVDFRLGREDRWQRLSGPGFTPAPVALAPGRALLALRSEAGETFEREIEVVDAAPAPPADVGAGADGDLRATLEAAWLLGQDGGAWRFEASQRLARIAGRYPPARALLAALDAGQAPGAPLRSSSTPGTPDSSR
jgi:hypothetical protein